MGRSGGWLVSQSIYSTAKFSTRKVPCSTVTSWHLLDDIWIISKTLSFNPDSTFIASSAYYGPSSSGELELHPIRWFKTVISFSNSVVLYVIKLRQSRRCSAQACTENAQNDAFSFCRSFGEFVSLVLAFLPLVKQNLQPICFVVVVVYCFSIEFFLVRLAFCGYYYY